VRKIGGKFFYDRIALLEKAKNQLDNFDYGVVIDRGCDVDTRTKDENESQTRIILNNVVTNISKYLIKFYGFNPNEDQDGN